MQNVIFNLYYKGYRIRIDSANIWVFGSNVLFDYDVSLAPWYPISSLFHFNKRLLQTLNGICNFYRLYIIDVTISFWLYSLGGGFSV